MKEEKSKSKKGAHTHTQTNKHINRFFYIADSVVSSKPTVTNYSSLQDIHWHRLIYFALFILQVNKARILSKDSRRPQCGRAGERTGEEGFGACAER